MNYKKIINGFLIFLFAVMSFVGSIAYASDSANRLFVLSHDMYGRRSLDTQTVKYDAEHEVATFWTKNEHSLQHDGVYTPYNLNHEMINFRDRTLTKFGEAKYVNGTPSAETTHFEAPEGTTFCIFPGDDLADKIAQLCGRQPLYARPLWKVVYNPTWEKYPDKYSVDLNNIEIDQANNRAVVYVLFDRNNKLSYLCDFAYGTISSRNGYSKYFGPAKEPVPDSPDEAIYNEAHEQYTARTAYK